MIAPQVTKQMKATMQAVLLKGHGGFEQLEFRDDVPIPEPAPGEVLIRVGAAGVNNTDINTRTGWYSHAVAGPADSGWTGAPSQFPRIQGADACGRIVAVGANVDPSRVGQRVLIEPVFRTPGRCRGRRTIPRVARRAAPGGPLRCGRRDRGTGGRA